MGEIRRKRKKFNRPRKRFDRPRIEAEDELVKTYGLKNKREIWKAKSFISRYRRRAKELIGSEVEEQKEFFEKLNKMGMRVKDISDVLALTEKDLLDRRLQTILFKKKMANTPRQARQMIVHKKVLVKGNVVNIPSFIVTRDLENQISVRERKLKEKVEKESIEGKKELEKEDNVGEVENGKE